MRVSVFVMCVCLMERDPVSTILHLYVYTTAPGHNQQPYRTNPFPSTGARKLPNLPLPGLGPALPSPHKALP